MRRKATGWLRIASVAGASLLLAASPSTAAADTAFTIRDPRITESSGLARDVDEDCYWTVNDSGDTGRVFAVRPNGTVAATISIRTPTEDVEAVALADDVLYLADIGDNAADRASVTVYYFDRPDLFDQTVGYRAYDFSYPDGPQDAEALLVDRRGRILIVSKGLSGGIYEAPAVPSRQEVNELTRVADAPPFVTDGTFLPGGRIALRTYLSVEILDATTFARLESLDIPAQPQGESVALSLDARQLLIGSEGARSEVLTVDLPRSDPTPTPTPTTQPAPADQVVEEEAPTGDEPGGLPVLGWAALLAVVAGAAAALARRR